jgi:hypothetical protein
MYVYFYITAAKPTTTPMSQDAKSKTPSTTTGTKTSTIPKTQQSK